MRSLVTERRRAVCRECRVPRRAASGERGTHADIIVWEADTGTKLHRLKRKSLQGAVSYLAWSPSGAYLAAVGQDENHLLHVFGVEKGKFLNKAKVTTDKVLDVAFISDSEIMTVGTKHAKMFTLKTEKKKAKLDKKKKTQKNTSNLY